MSVSESGSVHINEPLSGAGDHIDLRTEMDSVLAISNCPQEWGPTNAHKPSTILLRVM